MWLNYVSLLGMSFENGRVFIDPVLPADWDHVEWTMRLPAGTYHIQLLKDPGLFRCAGKDVKVLVNGMAHEGPLPAARDGEPVEVRIVLGEGVCCAV
jgi:cellobiose phosphorylase